MSTYVLIIISTGLGAASGILSTSWKTRKDLEAQYDIDLRKRRIEAYAELWRKLQPLADYSPPAPLTYARLRDLSIELRCWYFEDGGLLLSDRTRPPYFNLQQALTGLVRERPLSCDLDTDTCKIVRALGSRLRTASTQDVATRVQPRLGGRARWWLERSSITVDVDQRWDWEAGGRRCHFVLVENRSRRSVQITALELDGEAANPDPELPVALRPAERLELTVKDSDPGRPKRLIKATITLAGGGKVHSKERPGVPIPADVLARAPRQDS